MDAKSAQTAWEKANNIHVLSADEVYRFDAEKYKDSLKGDPWKKEYALHSLIFGSNIRQFRCIKLNPILT